MQCAHSGAVYPSVLFLHTVWPGISKHLCSLYADLHIHKFDIQICSWHDHEDTHWSSLVGGTNLAERNTSGFYLRDPYGLLTTVVRSRWLEIDLVLMSRLWNRDRVKYFIDKLGQ